MGTWPEGIGHPKPMLDLTLFHMLLFQQCIYGTEWPNIRGSLRPVSQLPRVHDLVLR